MYTEKLLQPDIPQQANAIAEARVMSVEHRDPAVAQGIGVHGVDLAAASDVADLDVLDGGPNAGQAHEGVAIIGRDVLNANAADGAADHAEIHGAVWAHHRR